MKNVFFMFVLICVSVGIISSCSSDDEAVVATATTAAEAAPTAITGTATTIAGTTYTYTKSMMSTCMDTEAKDDDGVALYYRTQFFLYDNKTMAYHDQVYNSSTCTTALSSYTIDSTTTATPTLLYFDNASYEQNSTDRVFTGTITDNSSNVLDSSTYHVLIYNQPNCGNRTPAVAGQGYMIDYLKSATEIQMTNRSCISPVGTWSGSDNDSNAYSLVNVFTSQ